MMGGTVLEFTADKYFNAGRVEGREEGRVEGREEGRVEGRVEGREEGREEGEQKLASLLTALRSLGRVDDVFKALEDPAYREKLYRELQIA